LFLSLAVLGTIFVAPPASARGFGKAGVVVVHGDGTVKTECVRLNRQAISGFKLLSRSGLEYRTAPFDFGEAVCWLDGEGVDTTNSSDCFSDPQMRFWGYWTQDKGEQAPAESEVGASERVVTRGAVDYWVWDSFPQDPPAPLTLKQICS
jgi:hypothetical protein